MFVWRDSILFTYKVNHRFVAEIQKKKPPIKSDVVRGASVHATNAQNKQEIRRSNKDFVKRSSSATAMKSTIPQQTSPSHSFHKEMDLQRCSEPQSLVARSLCYAVTTQPATDCRRGINRSPSTRVAGRTAGGRDTPSGSRREK